MKLVTDGDGALTLRENLHAAEVKQLTYALLSTLTTIY